MSTTTSVDKVLTLFNQYGDSNYLGECVSKTKHMVQCAQLAQQEGHDQQVIAGALLHDIGHLVGIHQNTTSMVTDGEDLGAKHHDLIGGKYLQDLGFPAKVCDIVSGHVQAKRYLVYKFPDYYSKLSDASKLTLEHQNGPMSREESERFEESALFNVIIHMRRWDDLAKDPERLSCNIETYRQLLTDVLKKS